MLSGILLQSFLVRFLLLPLGRYVLFFRRLVIQDNSLSLNKNISPWWLLESSQHQCLRHSEMIRCILYQIRDVESGI